MRLRGAATLSVLVLLACSSGEETGVASETGHAETPTGIANGEPGPRPGDSPFLDGNGGPLPTGSPAPDASTAASDASSRVLDASTQPCASQGNICALPDTCRVGIVQCPNGRATCVDQGPKAAGSPCGTNKVCSPSGACISCEANAACNPGGACRRGEIACTSGVVVCRDVGSAAVAEVCGNNRDDDCNGVVDNGCPVRLRVRPDCGSDGCRHYDCVVTDEGGSRPFNANMWCQTHGYPAGSTGWFHCARNQDAISYVDEVECIR